MRALRAVLLLAGCDAGKKAPPAPAPEPAPVVAVADASLDSAPAPSPCIGEGSPALTLAAVPDDCELQADTVLSIEGRARMAPSSARPLKPPSEHVVFTPADDLLGAIEATSAKELAKLVSCRHPIKVDWKRDHVWVVTYAIEDGRVDVTSAVDDGRSAILRVSTVLPTHAGDAAPSIEVAFTLAVVPAARTVILDPCTQHL